MYTGRGWIVRVGFTSVAHLIFYMRTCSNVKQNRSVIILSVGLQLDPSIDRPDLKNPPVQSIVERQAQLSAVKYVDEILVYTSEKDLEDIFD